MKSPFSPTFLLALAVLPLPQVFAQPAPSDQLTPVLAGDSEWELLKNLGRPKSSSSGASGDLIRDADRLKDFYTRHPNHPEAKNAKCLEALALVQAWLAGDTSQEARRDQAVAEVRHDKAVSVSLRAELFALADHVAIGKRQDLSHNDKLLAYEGAVRALIGEFPTLPNGYESLMYIARDSRESRGPVLAREVAGMADAPAWVRTEAQVVAERFGLVGSSLPGLVTPILGRNHALSKSAGRPVVIYTWASTSLVGIMRAKVLAAKVPEGAAIIGVCLDAGDSSVAKNRALAEALPGEQIYDAAGRNGPLVQTLRLFEPGLIYLTDAAGIIRSVSAQHDLGGSLSISAR